MADSAAETYVMWSKRPEWQDLEPVPQNDAPNCLVPIAYDGYYRDAMDMFRAIVAKQEKSKRTLDLTKEIIQMNPGHYTVWKYRADTLLQMQTNLSEELDLLDQLVKHHLKSYQVWQHRRTIVLALDDPSRELDFTAKALALDSKNYHTWAYRQWVLLHFWSASSSSSKERTPSAAKVWEGEIAYADRLLQEDLRNNSAWNHRFFVAFESGMGGDCAEREIRYAKEKLAISPNNPSAWNYLRGILKRLQRPLSTYSDFIKPLALNTPETVPAGDPPISEKAELPAWLAIEYLADAAAEDAAALKADEEESRRKRAEKVKEAADLFRSLEEFDPIRRFYYEFCAKRAESLLQTVPASA
ncbi:hypothetical protein JCM10908_004655 [Rhodotorula pacifica]|uniref:uncharacterized protein n=1 Tax=Rhodotorula pacifica TaxID=1495444 RepID=UPI00316E27D3